MKLGPPGGTDFSLCFAWIAVVSCVIAIGCSKPVHRQEASAYVNPALCGSCHPAIAKAYRLTGMGRSFFRPRAENVVEDYQTKNTLYHRASDRYYTMIARDGRWFERRHQLGFEDRETNIVESQIDYVVGSGNHARTYLHRTAEGKLAELPVTWYAEKGGYWAMSPGYDRPDQSDFRRAISYDCMSCHNGYPSSVPAGSDTIFADIPDGIDCQRCHGPGSAHVKAATSQSATRESIRRAIVNPQRLTRERQLDVCMQCHLQTTSLRSPDSIRRYNRPPFTYQPGETLEDYMVHLDFPGQDTFEIDHAAYRLAKSKCFERSQMTCTTCHDPHQVSPQPERYDAICRNCHDPAHPASVATKGKSCLGCHMPKRRAEDVVHVVMTDHYIQRRKAASDLLAPREELHLANTNQVALYQPSSDAELYRGVAEAQQRRTATLQSAIDRYHPAQPEFYFELGRAYIKSGDVEKGIHQLNEALRVREDFAPTLKELGAALSDSGQLSRAAEVLEKVTPADADALTDLGGVYIQQGNLDRAEQVLQQAISLNPDLPAAHNLLGLEKSRKGDQQGAEASFREAIRIQPDLSAAQNNLGNLLAGTGDIRQAIFHFNKAVSSDPDNVDARYNLGQALAATGSFEQALNELATVVRVKPGFAKAHSDLGRLLAMQGRTGQAIEHFRLAIEIDSTSAEAHYYLGDLLTKQKKLTEAEQQFHLAIQSNPDFYAAHFALGRLLAAKGNRAEAETHLEKASHSPDPELRKAVSRFR